MEHNNIYTCKYTPPKLNYINSLFITTHSKASNARDGMTGSLNYNVMLEIAKLNGITGNLLDDFIDFVNAMENEISTKRSNDKS